MTLGVALVAVLILLPGGRAEAKTPANFYGVSPVTVLSQSEANTAKAGGVTMLRPTFPWNGIEPEAGTFDFTKSDSIVTSAANAGIDIAPVLFQTPPWASGCSDNPRCLYVPPIGTQSLRDGWDNYLKALVQRYGPNGSFWTDPLNILAGIPYHPIRNWIVWNEENGRTFFPPKASPAKYASFLARSAAAIRSVDPGATIVLGGLAGGSNVDHNVGSMPAAKFLTNLYKQKGARNNFDVVALHPYSATVKNLKQEVDADRAAMNKAHAASTPIWLTELGWASNKSPSLLSVGLKRQAKLLTQSFSLVNKKRKAWNVKKLFWFTWRDVGKVPCVWCGYAGLFTQAGTAKPAWSAYKKFAK